MKCGDIFKNAYIENVGRQIRISPCCVSAPVEVDSFDFTNNTYLNRFRDAVKKNQWPIECKTCQNLEQNNGISRRIGSNQWYTDHNLDDEKVELRRLDYWVGDQCNLACAICGPTYSTFWKQQLNWPIRTQKSINNEFWKTLDLEKIQFIHFNGGEPLLNKQHVEFLKAVPNKSLVHLNYNTNGTIKPSTELFDLWCSFKLVQIDFSIDDLYQRFEYQRWPAKWESVVEVLDWYLESGNHNFMYAVNTTVSMLNMHNLTNLSAWLDKNFSYTKFSDRIPHRQQPANGTFAIDACFEKVIEKLESLDRQRGTNWKHVFPELIV